MSVEPMRNLVEIIFSYATDKTIRLHVFLHTLQLVTELSKSIDN